MKQEDLFIYVPLVVSTLRSFPHSWLITGFIYGVTRWVSLVELELLSDPVYLGSTSILSGVRSICIFLYGGFCRSLFLLFFLDIVLSVFRFADSDYPFGVLILFLYIIFYILIESLEGRVVKRPLTSNHKNNTSDVVYFPANHLKC